MNFPREGMERKVIKLFDSLDACKEVKDALRVWTIITVLQFLPAEVRSKYELCHKWRVRSNVRSYSLPDTSLSSC